MCRSGQFRAIVHTPTFGRSLVPSSPCRSPVITRSGQTGTCDGRRKDAYVLPIFFKRYVLPSNNPQLGGVLTVEDLAFHRNFTSAELDDGFPRFPDGQRTCECEGNCSEKKNSLDQSTSKYDAGKKLTESEEGEEGNNKSGGLHVEGIGVERRG